MTHTGSIEIENVWKTFRIFHDRNTTLKQAVIRRKGKEVYEEFWALRDVSFTIPTGSTFGLVGANGAGKSTLLKLLARILVPDKGSVTANGRISALLELGAGFHPELSGRENVFLNGSILGMTAATLRSKFDDIVQFAGLEDFIDQPIKTYSSGMYARLGFSVAVAVEPDILLIDEVLAVGDEQFQRRCAEKMAELRSGGRTVVIVSHSLATIQQTCDGAAWLDHGELRHLGRTEDVISDYLASVSTNFRLDDRGRQRTGSGEIQLEVELINDDDVLTATSDLTIRFHWTSAERLDGVGFGFTLRSADGYIVTGAGTGLDERWRTVEKGSGVIDFVIPELRLLPGSYHIAVACLQRGTGHVYDHCPNIVEFDVAAAKGNEHLQGFVTLDGFWTPGGER
jgi:ABC-2 type transport system ATP-binding protein